MIGNFGDAFDPRSGVGRKHNFTKHILVHAFRFQAVSSFVRAHDTCRPLGYLHEPIVLAMGREIGVTASISQGLALSSRQHGSVD